MHSIDPKFRVMIGCGISHTNTGKYKIWNTKYYKYFAHNIQMVHKI